MKLFGIQIRSKTGQVDLELPESCNYCKHDIRLISSEFCHCANCLFSARGSKREPFFELKYEQHEKQLEIKPFPKHPYR